MRGFLLDVFFFRQIIHSYDILHTSSRPGSYLEAASQSGRPCSRAPQVQRRYGFDHRVEQDRCLRCTMKGHQATQCQNTRRFTCGKLEHFTNGYHSRSSRQSPPQVPIPPIVSSSSPLQHSKSSNPSLPNLISSQTPH
jgi:hypothetical protein